MEWIIPDFYEIIVYKDVTFYQVLGGLTLALALADTAIYGWIILMFKNTKHAVGQDLVKKFSVDILLLITTALMGVGALFEMPSSFWQLAYISRVGILILAPIVSIKLALTCLGIVKALTDETSND